MLGCFYETKLASVAKPWMEGAPACSQCVQSKEMHISGRRSVHAFGPEVLYGIAFICGCNKRRSRVGIQEPVSVGGQL